MRGYTARDVARMLDLSVGQVRSYAKAGFLDAERSAAGEYRFSFQDLVLLRTAKGLVAASIPPRKVRNALRKLKDQLPTGRPLSGLQITADGEEIVVRQGNAVWNPESGQGHFDFDVDELADKVAPHARRAVEEAEQEAAQNDSELDAEDWFELGTDLEAAAPEHAREAYRRALELDPGHVDARVNLGRLLHESRRLESAEAHYRLALASQPGNATALFNLGVSLEDLGRSEDAIRTYLAAIEAEPGYADAYYNLARLYEQTGHSADAVRYLRQYRKLVQDPGSS